MKFKLVAIVLTVVVASVAVPSADTSVTADAVISSFGWGDDNWG